MANHRGGRGRRNGYDDDLKEKPGGGGARRDDNGRGQGRFGGDEEHGEREARGGGRRGGRRGPGGRGRGGGRGGQGERGHDRGHDGNPRQQMNGGENVRRMDVGGRRVAEEEGEVGRHERQQGGRREVQGNRPRGGGYGRDGVPERAPYEGRAVRNEERRGDAAREMGHHARIQQRGGGGGHGRDSPMPSNFLTQQDVEKLAQSNSEEVLTCVMENEQKFLAAYKFARFCNHPVLLKRLIKILYLLVGCEERNVATRIVARLFDPGSSDYAMFLNKVNGLVRSMQIEVKPFIRDENPLYLNYLVEIGLMAIQTIPRTVITSFPIDSIQQTLEVLANLGREKVENLSTKVRELKEAFSLATSEIVQRSIAKPRDDTLPPDNADIDPPQSFTELTVLPTVEEIHSTDVFLRPNMAKGGYRDWEHYLDVQFRLLREDFVQPLRSGINQYCDTGSGRKSKDVYVYENVNVLNPVCLVSGVGFQIRFDVSRFKRLNWEHSKRLIFGSLLCLSSDDFNQRILFASVAKRDATLLKDGLLLMKFEGNVNGFTIDPAESFVMVESTAYFEAYRHVLESLQKLSKSPDTIPMKRYIVDCQLHGVHTPSFLRFRKTTFDLKTVLKVNQDVVITDPNAWPLAEKTCLNRSQMEAFKMALTKEVCIIQGPPGTGKTYVGLKIVSSYLINRKAWDPQFASPILVVCYTNHALDQFLEGIQECVIDGQKPNIVRVGGRCKSEELASSVLRQRVQEVRSKRLLPSRLHKDYIQGHNIMQRCQKKIDQAIENCDKASRKILSLSVLEKVLPEDFVTQLRFGNPTEAGKEIEVWLELWYPEQVENDSESGSAQAGVNEPQDGIPARQEVEDETQDGTDSEEDEREFIRVDEEARVLQEERMMEGEEVELPRPHVAPQETNIPGPAKKEDGTGWTTVQISASKRKSLINKGLKRQPMPDGDVLKVNDVWELSIKKRWQLYCFWLNKYIRLCKGKINSEADIYNDACEYYKESKDEIDCFVINSHDQRVDVVGMTTTGAAKHHHILEGIQPKIVIFEEAAEIFEAHIVTSLPASVEQVVLIGDHKQLQPKPNCYNLGKKYNFAMSLFERFATNDIEYVTLNYQHRMRPEIARLISPSIYDNLINHDQVKAYEPVKGIGKNMFLVDHTHPEEPNESKDMKTHVNKHEAGYLVELCHYLLKQGYSHKQITILTMYRGQLLELKRRMKRQYFEGVRVAAVDDYQGEENDIILLSLVRSNSDGKIGFLKIENRVCVSLSRAKQGLFIIGNVSMLRDKVETVWPKIIEELQDQKSVGKALPLYCQIHADDKLDACKPEDFRNRPEGGCTRVCGARLDCGHGCTKLCHPTDREHKYFMCMKKCEKELSCGHRCKHKCFECKEGCMPCREQVKKTRPACGHTVQVPCSSNPSSIPCPFPCPKKLRCGHDCQDFCSDRCSSKCYFKVPKKFPCGHMVEVPCYTDPNSTSCPVPCEAVLECKHKCTGTCGECRLGRLHKKCFSNCGRLLVCGHVCDFPCGAACPPCMKPCNNFCHHSHCPRKCYEPCEECREKCKWECPHHRCMKLCGEFCNRQRCDEPCTKLLKCGHPCIGLCGERCPSKCRECDKEDVQELLFGSEEEEDARFIQLEDCNDIVEVTGLDRWMKIEGSDSTEVKFKVCPKCSTPIRKSFRYGNAIKQVLHDVQEIKLKQAKASQNLPEKLNKVQKELSNQKSTEYVDSELKFIENEVRKYKTLNLFRVNTVHFQLTVLPKILMLSSIHEALEPVYNLLNLSGCSPEHIQESTVALKRFVMQDFLSHQQITDAAHEARRLTCSAKLLDLLCKIRVKGCRISQPDLTAIVDEVRRVHVSGVNEHEKLSEEDETKVCKFIKLLSDKYSVDGLSNEERIRIVEAVGLDKGHWFKCPNGHFYAIADCGGAITASRCPDCKVPVGGTSYQLSAGNRHAPEMDGSRYPAWSNEANDNYVP